MTSSNGDIFRITGHLCGEFTGHRWIPRTKASDAELWFFFFDLRPNTRWVNNREAGDLRHHRAHYDVIVMYRHCSLFSLCALEMFSVHIETKRSSGWLPWSSMETLKVRSGQSPWRPFPFCAFAWHVILWALKSTLKEELDSCHISGGHS